MMKLNIGGTVKDRRFTSTWNRIEATQYREENHTERIEQPTTTDTGEFMRSKQNITKYVDIMAKLVQAVVRSKAFKKDRTKHPFSCDWVTVSDEVFLIFCLGNYEKTWRAKNLGWTTAHRQQADMKRKCRYQNHITPEKVMGQSKAGQERDEGFQWLYGKGSLRLGQRWKEVWWSSHAEDEG